MLKSYCLQTHFIPEDHIGCNIENYLIESLARWSLNPEKQVAMTTDNGANVKLACELLKVWESSLDAWIKAQYICLSQESLKVIVGRLDQGSIHSFISKESGSHRWMSRSRLMHSFISKESGSHRWTSRPRLNTFIYLKRV